jgi:hypothetical protein
LIAKVPLNFVRVIEKPTEPLRGEHVVTLIRAPHRELLHDLLLTLVRTNIFGKQIVRDLVPQAIYLFNPSCDPFWHPENFFHKRQFLDRRQTFKNVVVEALELLGLPHSLEVYAAEEVGSDLASEIFVDRRVDIHNHAPNECGSKPKQVNPLGVGALELGNDAMVEAPRSSISAISFRRRRFEAGIFCGMAHYRWLARVKTARAGRREVGRWPVGKRMVVGDVRDLVVDTEAADKRALRWPAGFLFRCP